MENAKGLCRGTRPLRPWFSVGLCVGCIRADGWWDQAVVNRLRLAKWRKRNHSPRQAWTGRRAVRPRRPRRQARSGGRRGDPARAPSLSQGSPGCGATPRRRPGSGSARTAWPSGSPVRRRCPRSRHPVRVGGEARARHPRASRGVRASCARPVSRLVRAVPSRAGGTAPELRVGHGIAAPAPRGRRDIGRLPGALRQDRPAPLAQGPESGFGQGLSVAGVDRAERLGQQPFHQAPAGSRWIRRPRPAP